MSKVNINPLEDPRLLAYDRQVQDLLQSNLLMEIKAYSKVIIFDSFLFNYKYFSKPEHRVQCNGWL